MPLSRTSRSLPAALGALALGLCLALTGGSPAAAATTQPVDAAAGWLATQFEDTSHLPAPAGDHFDNKFGTDYFANYGANADAIFGLAASRTGADKAAVALAYLRTHLDDYADLSKTFGGPFDGSVAKTALAAQVSGASATSFGGHNLLQILKDDECPAATTDGTCAAPGSALSIFSSVSESLTVLAEARAGGSYAPSPVAVTYLLSLQCADGGFTGGTAACGSGAADLDATSYALMALQALGGHATQADAAATWLTGQRQAGGWWVSQNVANVNSTGLATAALSGHGDDVSASRAWLLSQQVPAGQPGAGALKFGGAFTPTTLTATSTSVTATAQGLTGLVDGGSLATLTAAGSTAGTDAFAPVQTVSPTTGHAGGTRTVTGTGFAPGETVTATVSGSSITGHAATDASGVVRITLTVPSTLAAGHYTVTLTGAASQRSGTVALTVTSATPSATPTPTPTASATSSAPAPVLSSGGGSTTAGGGATLPDTGTDTAAELRLAGVGGLLVLLGGGLLRVGSRRRA